MFGQAAEQVRSVQLRRTRSGSGEATSPLQGRSAALTAAEDRVGALPRRNRSAQLEAGSPSGSARLSDDGVAVREGRAATALADGSPAPRRVRISGDAAAASPRHGRSPRIGMFEEGLRGSMSLQGALPCRPCFGLTRFSRGLKVVLLSGLDSFVVSVGHHGNGSSVLLPLLPAGSSIDCELQAMAEKLQ